MWNKLFKAGKNEHCNIKIRPTHGIEVSLSKPNRNILHRALHVY